MQETFSISTNKKEEAIDITGQVQNIVEKSKVKQGICTVYLKHTSAAITINENADPSIWLDTFDAMSKIIQDGVWRHDNVDGNASSHIKAIILGQSETIPIKDNKLQLGTWQAPTLVELDGPRKRSIIVQIVGE